MIEESRSVNTYVPAHEHYVTKCLHEAEAGKPPEGGSRAGDTVNRKEPEIQKDLSTSLKDFLSGGVASLVSRASRLFGAIGGDAAAESEKQGKDNNGVLSVKEEALHNPLQTVTAQAAVASALVKNAEEKRNSSSMAEAAEKAAGKVKEINQAVHGGLEKEQRNTGRFLQKCKETAGRAMKLLKREISQPDKRSAGSVDTFSGDSSYLLDSYDKAGEYSTLGKSGRPEGKFQAKG